jgi:hypothetical protein
MRGGEEFATWLAARWPSLVRSLVFFGHHPNDAERLAGEGVARALPGWEREAREGDVDVHVWRAVLQQHDRALRHDAPAGGPGSEPVDLPPGLSDRLERRRELEAHLGALGDADRTRTVLVHVAELSEDQVAELVDGVGSVRRLPLDGPDVRDACEAVPVSPAPVTGVVARARSRRRTAWTRGIAVAGAVAVLLAATTWWTTRPSDTEQGRVVPASNPLPIPWYADGRLHLARVTVEVDGLLEMVDVPDGVVYSDTRGRVVIVDSSGAQTPIGETVAGSRLAASSDSGWVAWADPGDGSPFLVVHDTIAGSEVGRRSLAGSQPGGGQPVGDSQPIAIEGERVYYSSADGDFAWDPLVDISFALAGTMLDTAAGARVTRTDGVVRLSPAPFRTGVVIDADDARLTPDGNYAFAVEGEVLSVLDVETGKPIEPMYSPSDVVVAWGYHEGSFVFALLHNLADKAYQDMLQMPSVGNYRLYVCRPGLVEPCRRLAEVPEEVPEAPVFPSD